MSFLATTREALIDLHRLVSGNVVSVASKLGGGRHGNLALTMASEECTEQMGYAFLFPHNPGNYPPTVGTSLEQALVTKRFRQNQALFRRYTAVEGSLKKKTVTAVQPVFLSPLM